MIAEAQMRIEIVGRLGPPFCPCPICGDQVWDLALMPRDPLDRLDPQWTIRYVAPRNVWHAWRCGHAWVGDGWIDFEGLTYEWAAGSVHETNPCALFDERADRWRRISWT